MAKQGINVREPLKTGERPRVRDLLGCLEESSPSGARKGAPTLIRRTPSAAASATVMNGVSMPLEN